MDDLDTELRGYMRAALAEVEPVGAEQVERLAAEGRRPRRVAPAAVVAAVASVLLLVVGVGVVLDRPGQVEVTTPGDLTQIVVPDVRGMTLADALVELRAVGLDGEPGGGEGWRDPDHPDALVVRQLLPAGATVDRGDVVVLRTVVVTPAICDAFTEAIGPDGRWPTVTEDFVAMLRALPSDTPGPLAEHAAELFRHLEADLGADVVPAAVVNSAALHWEACTDWLPVEAPDLPRPTDPGGELVAANGMELVDSQPTLPDEPGDVFADVVTDPDDLPVVWQRFRMEGSPPPVDLEDRPLLFLGLVESRSCPVAFYGGSVEDDRVEVRIGLRFGREIVGPGEPWPEGDGCTRDRRPRTLVIAVGGAGVPQGAFVLDVARDWTSFRAVLSGSPVETPPPSPSSLWGEGEQIDAEFVAEPASAAVGATVEILLRNASSATAGLWDRPVLQRWDRQRWLPVAGHSGYQQHPAVRTVGRSAAPGETALFFEVDTAGFAPGWYAVHAPVSGDGGHHGKRGAFRLEGDTTR